MWTYMEDDILWAPRAASLMTITSCQCEKRSHFKTLLYHESIFMLKNKTKHSGKKFTKMLMLSYFWVMTLKKETLKYFLKLYF